MKKIFILTAILLCAYSAYSQTEKWEYCRVYYHEAGLSLGAIAFVDMGKEPVLEKEQRLIAMKDSVYRFELPSIVFAMNRLGEQGWELVSSYEADIMAVKHHVLLFKRKRK